MNALKCSIVSLMRSWYFLIKSVVSISIVLFSIFFLGVVYTDIAFMNNTYVLPLLVVVEEY